MGRRNNDRCFNNALFWPPRDVKIDPEFQDKISKKTEIDSLRELQNKTYIDEEVSSDVAYSRHYEVKTLYGQIYRLVDRYQLDSSKALAFSKKLPKLPAGAEGWFAFPKWQAIDSIYGRAVERMLMGVPALKNRRRGQINEMYLRQCQRTEQMLAKIYSQQDGDIIILPAQTGIYHRGRSARRSREVFFNNEFGLGAFMTLSILFIHPERIEAGNHLFIYCSGDDFSIGGFSFSSHVPVITCDGFKRYFDVFWSSTPSENYGTASGFVL